MTNEFSFCYDFGSNELSFFTVKTYPFVRKDKDSSVLSDPDYNMNAAGPMGVSHLSITRVYQQR